MKLIPAIDLLDGKVVRLHQGDYAKVTVYAADPVAEARRFAQAGAKTLHVVDLEGARSGAPAHEAVVREILESVSMDVQVGGGIRTRESAERWLAAGASGVVLGTAAIRDPDMTRALCAAHPGKVIVAVDARAGEVSVEGWTEGSGVRVEELATDADLWGVAALLYTDVERDGTREGPAVEATAALQRRVRATVIASGGIGTLEHLEALALAGVRSAVCGRALYSGAFTLADAFARLRAVQAGGQQ